MRKRKSQPNQPTEESLGGELITGHREYTLKNPITYKGDLKVPGEKVELNDRQADWLKGSGHI